MTGKLYNKKNRQSGQAFLIIIMFISIAITVALATSFKSITETQVTKSQEDSVKAVAAADAGVEYGLKNMDGSVPMKSYADLGISPGPAIDTTQSNVIVNVDSSPEFVSPLLKKDSQYTFYWAVYSNGTLGAGASPANLFIYYGSANGTNCNDVGLEISLIQVVSGSDYSVDRYVADTGRLFTENMKNVGSATSGSVGGTSFACKASFNGSDNIASNTKLIIVRYLTKGTAQTKLGFTSDPGKVIPAQGKWVIAQAVTKSGVKRVVQALQTYPQIPAEFFVTSF